jgi:aspartyl protease family protein
MRNILIFAAVLVGVGAMMAKMADRMDSKPVSVQVASNAPMVPAASGNDNRASGPRTMTVDKNRRGHFQVDGRVAGRSLGFMVDTGASVIALTAQDAARVGVRPMRSDYDVSVSTANGTVKAARTRLATVEIGGLIVRDVDALVLPEGALSENLLGLSFLSKLKRYEFAGSKLVMEQ